MNGETFDVYSYLSFEKLHNIINIEEKAEDKINDVKIVSISYPYSEEKLIGLNLYKQI